jgi:hypothetical protein
VLGVHRNVWILFEDLFVQGHQFESGK